MPVVSIKPIQVFNWIPPALDYEHKITIVTDAGTTDITSDVVTGSYTDGVSETIGNFTITLDNTHQTYTGLFSLYDQVQVYSDYATTATTLRFTGVIEKVSYTEEDITITGRSIASKVMGNNVTYAGTDYTNVILSAILTTYASEVTQTNIDTSTETDTSVTVNWYQKPFWECVLELCNRAGYDAYIDCNNDFHYFVSGSRLNASEAVVHDNNLIEVSDFTPDLTNVKNRIIVYGAVIEEMPIIWMAEDSTSIASYDVREEIITDTSIITPEQAKDRADYELSIKKDPPIIGEVSCDALATILPGEKIRISDPVSGINPGEYVIRQFTQNFEDIETTLTIQKEQSTISKILKQRISFESESVEKDNPNEMHYSINYDFNTNVGYHTNTLIESGVLKTDGGTLGTWLSPLTTLDANLTAFDLRVNGDNIVNNLYWLSTNGGLTWQSFSALKTKYTASIPGTNIMIKVQINSATTLIDSLALLYQ